jgi:hypothetical protein
MAMPEPAYAYDGAVLSSEVDRKHQTHFIIRDGKEYVSFVDATRPAELDAMELGWERYQSALAHEKQAETELLKLAKALYPELEPATKWPTLWVVIPELDARHDTRYVGVQP